MRTIAAAFLLLAAASDTTILLDQDVDVDPSRFRTLSIQVKSGGARVICSYSVVEGESGVRVLLMSKPDAERFARGQSHATLAGTAYEREGAFSYAVTRPGEYKVVLDNRMEGRGRAVVHLHVRTVTGDVAMRTATELPPRRKFVVIGASLLVFGLIAAWAGPKLSRAIAQRPSSGWPPPSA